MILHKNSSLLQCWLDTGDMYSQEPTLENVKMQIMFKIYPLEVEFEIPLEHLHIVSLAATCPDVFFVF